MAVTSPIYTERWEGRSVTTDGQPEWQRWNRFDWSARLLDHYFGHPELGPVVSLDVTDPELAAATGDPGADGEQVRTALVSAVVRSSSNADFFEVTLKSFDPSENLAHLVVSCLAAVDRNATEEAGFIAHFLTLLEGHASESRLKELPERWERLASWLKEHPAYRQLQLPDPGGWKRIGYSVRLAFPSRSDQRVLANCLRDADLVGTDPPTGLVIDCVARSRQKFSDDFKVRFDEFANLHRNGASNQKLIATPFWSTVRRVVGGASSDEAHPVGWTLIAEDDGFDLELVPATAEEPHGPDLQVEPNSDDETRWRYLVRAPAWEHGLLQTLAEVTKVPYLSPTIRDGVLAFVLNSAGQLELARRPDLPDSDVALVADDRVEVLCELFGARARVRASQRYPGWSVVRGLRLVAGPAERLSDTALQRCSILQTAPVPPAIRLVGGLRVENGFLGHRELLPTIRVPAASSVEAELPGERRIELRQVDSDTWTLPGRDLNGEVVLHAQLSERILSRPVVFHGRPSSEQPRQPTEPSGYLLEHLASAVPMPDLSDVPASSSVLPQVAGSDHRTFLGREVGEFVESEDAATWVVDHLGSRTLVRRRDANSDVIPRARVADDGSRTRWRKLLAKASAHPSDPDVQKFVKRVIGRKFSELPRIDTGRLPEPAAVGAVRPDHRVDRILEILVAYTNQRLGLRRHEWLDLLRTEINLDRAEIDVISRAWHEAGFVRELVNVRSSARPIAAVPPTFYCFRTESFVAATLIGTVLPSTRRRLIVSAGDDAVIAYEKFGPSALVPPVVSFRSSVPEGLLSFLAKTGFRVCALPDVPVWVRPRDLSRSIPATYAEADWDDVIELPAGARVTRLWQQHQPSIWRVDSGEIRTWAHHRSSAVFWAYALGGCELLRTERSQLLSMVPSMPRAVSTWLAAASGMPPGPECPGRYVIPASSATMAERAAEVVQQLVRRVVDHLCGGDDGGSW